jgi:hypothetical protein
VKVRFAAAQLWMLVLSLAVMGVGCPCVSSRINNNENTRWYLFGNYGANRVCPEMLKRGIPIKMQSLGPNSVGRFFPQNCRAMLNDQERSLYVDVQGTGYAFTSVTKRVGFWASIQVEFKPDFRMADDAMYVWGRFYRLPSKPDVRILGIENTAINVASQLPFGGDLTSNITQGFVTSEVGRGFTVIRSEDGDDFALGLLNPPYKPPRPFENKEERYIMATDTTEIHGNQRDYLGPFEIKRKDQGVFIKLNVQGAPLFATLVTKETGDLWRVPYERVQPLAAPPGPVLGSFQANPGQMTQFYPLNPGSYYLVVENRASGGIAPLGVSVPIPLTDVVSTLGYSLEEGERP